MAELKVYLPDELDTKFRKAAMEAFGYGRGSLSKAATEALARWCAERHVGRSPEAITDHEDALSHTVEPVKVTGPDHSNQENIGGSPTPASQSQ